MDTYPERDYVAEADAYYRAKFGPSPEEVGEEYLANCERHDLRVCTGRTRQGEIMPATPEEQFLVTKNALAEADAICQKHQIDRHDLRQAVKAAEDKRRGGHETF